MKKTQSDREDSALSSSFILRVVCWLIAAIVLSDTWRHTRSLSLASLYTYDSPRAISPVDTPLFSKLTSLSCFPDALSIFAMPRPFESDPSVAERQRVAFRSWLNLSPAPIVFLITDSPGIIEWAAGKANVHIVPARKYVMHNHLGTPYVNSLFKTVERLSPCGDALYINSDITLSQGIIPAAQAVREKRWNEYLMIGSRCNVDLPHPETELASLGYSSISDIMTHLQSSCHLDKPFAIDYFFFSKGLWKRIPDFLLGRMAWDQWLVVTALAMHPDNSDPPHVVDASGIVTAVHLRHDHGYQLTAGKDKNGRPDPWSGSEAQLNIEIWRLSGKYDHWPRINQVPWVVDPLSRSVVLRSQG
jgi:hypothetical protein